MRRKIKKIKKIVFIILVVSILLVLGIIIGKKVHERYQINKYNKIMEQKINELFVFNDINLDYSTIIQKYGIGTDNRNANDKIFCTTYNSNFDRYNVIRIFYYDDIMEVEKIDIYNYEDSKYELMNIITKYLGECQEYNDEIKELATEYKWIYNNYEIIFIDNIDSNTITIKKYN